MESKETILCEALIDALTFWCAGYRNVTSCYGIEGFTDEMLDSFVRHGTKRILIAFDRDGGGERGAAKVAEKLMEIGIECFRIHFPQGLDANSYAMQQGKTASGSLGRLIRGAHWLGQGKPPSPPEAVAETACFTGDNLHQAAKNNNPPTLAAQSDAESSANMPEEPSPPSSIPCPLDASPLPESPPDLPMVITGNDIRLTLGEPPFSRHYRIRGFSKNLSVEAMKINLLVGADTCTSTSG